MLLMIDNYDSFTFNVVQYFRSLDVAVKVVKNDELDLVQIDALNPRYIVISPGPGKPDDAGVSLDAVRAFAGRIPILGICLGHQVIGQVYGANVVKANSVMHGKMSTLHHHQQGVFAGLPSPYRVTRYHSLVLEPATLPDCLEKTAWVKQDTLPEEIMGIRHKKLGVEGVQFHPESIMTEHGKALLKNFLTLTKPL